jgi:hypothetical protein
MMSDSMEQKEAAMHSPAAKIRELHEHLELLLESHEYLQESGAQPISGSERTVARSVPATMPDVSIVLSALIQRDDQIRSELMRLQRTLSRQKFRGAESARRLVRKLARKAGQNIDEAMALGIITHSISSNIEQARLTEGVSEATVVCESPATRQSVSST